MEDKLTEIEILKMENSRPHVVILGAGATIATIPEGDKNGLQCSVMEGFVENLHLESLLSKAQLCTNSSNIEDIYSELYDRGDECAEIRLALEAAIYEYFSRLELPDYITIYDYILLSLTRKDCVATFNWDPLIIQAYNRVSKITDNLPTLTFLHGNVGVGYCPKCGSYGAIQREKCHNCQTLFTKSPLLYPVKQKDYSTNSLISSSWDIVDYYLRRAKLVTIFGYSAPRSDAEAVKLLKAAFEKYLPAQRFNKIEIIERPGFEHDKLSRAWRTIIDDSKCEYSILHSFYASYLSKHPRRTVEYLNKRNNGWWGDSNIKIYEDDSWDNIIQRFMPLIAEEKSGKEDLEVNPITPKDLMDVLIKLDQDSQELSAEDFYAKYEAEEFKCALRTPVPIENLSFYRSRMVSKVGDDEDLTSPLTFSYIPLNKKGKICRGRLNKEGQSMFYASFSPDTNYCEINHDIKEGDEVYLSQWRIKQGSSFMAFLTYLPENINVNVDLNTFCGVNDPYFAQGDMGEYFRKLSELITRIEENEEQRYLCSSFLASHILKQQGSAKYENKEIEVKYDSIIYPSVRKGHGELKYLNIVIPPSVVDSCLELVYVIKGKLKNDLSTVTSMQIGFCENNVIEWFELRLFPENLVFNNIQLIDSNNCSIDIGNHNCSDADGNTISKSSIKSYVKKRIGESIFNSINENDLLKNTFTYSQIKKENFHKSINLCCYWPVNGWLIDNDIEATCIYFEIEVKQELSS